MSYGKRRHAARFPSSGAGLPRDRPTPALDSILAGRGARITAWDADRDAVFSRATTTRFLAERYESLQVLRKWLFHPAEQLRSGSPHWKSRGVEDFAAALCRRGLLAEADSETPEGVGDGIPYTPTPGYSVYLKGGWLEELAFLAYVEAGADEVWRSVKLEWTVTGLPGCSEIDVVARRDSEISFASCKAVECMPTLGTGSKLAAYLNELVVWDQHFSGGAARAMLLVTTDLVNEVDQNRYRIPSLMARASLFDVALVGREGLGWNALVAAVRKHWA